MCKCILCFTHSIVSQLTNNLNVYQYAVQYQLNAEQNKALVYEILNFKLKESLPILPPADKMMISSH
ncbi:hypothetical protein ACS0TY_008278 [Phlomoides rotata]